jgi:hypothetical protein
MPAIESDGPAARPLQANYQLEQGALTRPIGADDGEDLAIVDSKIHSVDGRETAKVLPDLLELEKRHLLVWTG